MVQALQSYMASSKEHESSPMSGVCFRVAAKVQGSATATQFMK